MLNEMQAYLAMFEFLKEFNQRSNSEELSLLLSYLDINQYDGMPMDPAMWDDWICAIKKVVEY